MTQGQSTEESSGKGEPATVLIVEDEPLLREALVSWLLERGFRVISAPDCVGGTRRAVDDQPDCLLLDLQLPDAPGSELLRTLERLNLNIPAVILTGTASPVDGFDAARLGARCFIQKPASPDQIALALRGVIGAGSARRAPVNASYVRAALEILASRSQEKDLSVQKVAGAIGISADYLTRLFKSETGMSVLFALHATRVKNAERLLTSTAIGIKTIADSVGYHSTAEMDPHFAKHSGCSPSQFRARLRIWTTKDGNR